MIQKSSDTDFKKVRDLDSRDDFDDDDLEYVEYEINQAENCVQVIDHRRSDTDAARDKKEKDLDESVTKVSYADSIESYLQEYWYPDKVNRSKQLSHPPSKDQNFAFPNTTASKLGLKDEDARIVVTDTTGTVALTQSPGKRFILQTPLDDGPFCAMSLQQTTGFNYSGLYLYSDPIFRPLHILRDQTWFFCWRWNGLPILILPIAFLVAHDTYISARLAYLHTELRQIESALLVPDSESPDFSQLTRRLHEFSTALANLARRAHFQDTVLSTVTEALCTLNGPSGFTLEIQRARLDGLKKTMLARRYDLDMMPKRELTARATIFNLTVQRDQALSLSIGQANLEIARSARQIAEATMRDSAAMRTIAVLTMLFLPGTAVASFFSMTMFNWSPSNSSSGNNSNANSNNSCTGSGLVSNYIWIYFVLAVPLTALVLGIWWYWHRQRARDAKMMRRMGGGGGQGGGGRDPEIELERKWN